MSTPELRFKKSDVSFSHKVNGYQRAVKEESDIRRALGKSGLTERRRKKLERALEVAKQKINKNLV